jgi:glutaredoxin
VTVKLFVKQDCPRCPAAKRACEGLDGLEVYDVGEVDGLAEAAYYGVLSTPSVIVFDERGSELRSWRGEAPGRKDLEAFAGC